VNFSFISIILIHLELYRDILCSKKIKQN